MNAADTDKYLLSQWRQGNQTAWATLYERHGTRVYRFAYRLCGRAADAEDLAQDTFLSAYGGREEFAGRAPLAVYLCRITLNLWRQRGRLASARDIGPGDDGSLLGSTPDHAPAALHRLSLSAALHALPAEERAAFLLVKAEGFTSREAAIVLSVPQGTVQFRVFQATRTLRVLLSDEDALPVKDIPDVLTSL